MTQKFSAMNVRIKDLSQLSVDQERWLNSFRVQQELTSKCLSSSIDNLSNLKNEVQGL